LVSIVAGGAVVSITGNSLGTTCKVEIDVDTFCFALTIDQYHQLLPHTGHFHLSARLCLFYPIYVESVCFGFEYDSDHPLVKVTSLLSSGAKLLFCHPNLARRVSSRFNQRSRHIGRILVLLKIWEHVLKGKASQHGRPKMISAGEMPFSGSGVKWLV